MSDQISMIVLGSGSKGNAYYIWNKDTAVLIDCGLSTKQILLRLEKRGFIEPAIDAVFVTHEHGDHISSCAILERHLNRLGHITKFYMSHGTYHSAPERCLPKNYDFVKDTQRIKVGSLVIEAFEVPHDGTECLGYRVGYNHHWVGVITDLGMMTDQVLDKMKSLSIMAFEFNHDEDMLRNGPYPYQIQKRILSSFGHLSNQQAVTALERALSPQLQHLIVAHISEQNNCPQLVERMARGVLDSLTPNLVHLHVAQQREPSPIFSINQAPIIKYELNKSDINMTPFA
jgi:phosphoribosyl 1,2-cyclic phosphodiesterase